MFGFTPLVVGSVVHRRVKAEITRQHVNISSLIANFAIRNGLLFAGDPGGGKELPKFFGRFQQRLFFTDQRALDRKSVV